MLIQTRLTFRTAGRGSREITGEVAAQVRAAGIGCGIAQIFVQHTSCSLLLTENADPDVRRDLETLFGRIAPDGDPAYLHDADGPDDMAAHAGTLIAGASLTVPVAGARLLLGTWQGIYLWEHRTEAHDRNVVITVMGESA